MNFRSILIAILIFGSLIFIHELGHYLFARIFKVKINEFAIGMGPKLLSHQSKKTGIVYSWRLFPIGGYVSMDGEDEESGDPNAFCAKPAWQRLLITVAGPCMNILVGFLATIIMVLGMGAVSTTTIAGFTESAVSNADGYLEAGDEIVKIDNKRVHTRTGVLYGIIFGNFDTENVSVTKDGEAQDLENVILMDFTVIRNGERIKVKDVPFATEKTEDVLTCIPDFDVYFEHLSVGGVLRQSFFDAGSTIELIWQTFIDLIRGHYGLSSLSGPIGVTEAIDQVETHDFLTLLYLFILITMNLGAFNLIPFPALDGGRTLFLLLECIFRRPVISRKVEGYINFVGLMLLFLLMIVITCKDVFNLFV